MSFNKTLYVYHEKQSSQLCARHCLNNLLQGPYFTEFDLSQIALQLDKEEQELLSSDGNSGMIEWLKHNKESQNVSMDGNFSVQVLRRALQNLSLILHRWGSETVKDAETHPENEIGFICNLEAHWFSVRKINDSWFDLNSLSGLPETAAIPNTITNFYLSAYLSSLINEGFSIFVVRCENWPHFHDISVDDHLETYAKWYEAKLLQPRSKTYDSRLLKQIAQSRNGQNVTSLGWGQTGQQLQAPMNPLQRAIQESLNQRQFENADPELEHALALSMNEHKQECKSSGSVEYMDDDDAVLQKALAMSMADDETDLDLENVSEDEIVVVDEPDSDDESVRVCKLQLRMPNNKLFCRKFDQKHTLQEVKNYVLSLDDTLFDDIIFVCRPAIKYEDMTLSLESVCIETHSTMILLIVKQGSS